jgi:putative SOS response-associated peptidase YedK
MCGRYVLKAALPDIARMLGMDLPADAIPDLEPSYNIAPSSAVPACRMDPAGRKELTRLRWGLTPHWAKKADGGYSMINARAETVAEKPAFRGPFRQRRCLIPADGYYEWKSMEGRKQPFYFTLESGEPFCFAGLWEHWQSAEGDAVESCAIITTDANALAAEIHHRMPVILARADYEPWLDVRATSPEQAVALLHPYGGNDLTYFPVSTAVNNARVNEPRCITPLADPA